MAFPRFFSRRGKTPCRNQAKYWVLYLVLFFAIITGLLSLMFWLSARPKELRFSVVGGSITRYNLTNGGTLLDADLHLVLRARNPHPDVSFYYDKINATICYGNLTLSAAHSIPPFHQPRRNVTDLEWSSAARELRVEKASGNAEFSVKLLADIRWVIGAFKVHRTARVWCPSVRVPFGSSGKRFDQVRCGVRTDD